VASYTVNAGERGARNKTLVANTVDTVTFPAWRDSIEIWTDGTASIAFTTDGSTPTVDAATGEWLPATASTRTVKVSRLPAAGSPSGAPAATVVKLISTGTPKYSVQAA
jgi:hypothetical protein